MSSVETGSNLEEVRQFLHSLSLGDIYGNKRPNPKSIPITSDIYQRWGKLGREEREEELADFAEEFGIEDIGSYGGGGGTPFTVEETRDTRKLTWWIPSRIERVALLGLASALSPRYRLPTILDVGSGSGITATLLASSGKVNVIGVDPGFEKYHTRKIPSIPSHVSLLQKDLWDILYLGPNFTPEVGQRCQELLNTIRGVKRSFYRNDFLGGYFGDEEELVKEIQELQELSMQQVSESPIDIALCSFMDQETELTVPIRDGIYPKAIVYVLDGDGKTGAGDYYFAQRGGNFFDIDKWNESYERNTTDTDEDAEAWFKSLCAVIGPDTHVSHNPGRNYTTFGLWKTPSQLNWDHRRQTFEFFPDRRAEVVIQLRNDVDLGPVDLPRLETFMFDRQWRKCMDEANNLQIFYEGLHDGMDFLTQSGEQFPSLD